MYKALNTFIDDMFAFIIKMPTLHRLACFRDGNRDEDSELTSINQRIALKFEFLSVMSIASPQLSGLSSPQLKASLETTGYSLALSPQPTANLKALAVVVS